MATMAARKASCTVGAGPASLWIVAVSSGQQRPTWRKADAFMGNPWRPSG